MVESRGSKGEERRVDLGGGRWFWVSYDGGKRWKTGGKTSWSSHVTRREKNVELTCVDLWCRCLRGSYGREKEVGGKKSSDVTRS